MSLIVSSIAGGFALMSSIYYYNYSNEEDFEIIQMEDTIVPKNEKYCISCNRMRIKECFSNRQFKKNHKARCIDCICQLDKN